MSGHNKWSKIKHKKKKKDRERAKIFNKLSREIYVAAREGGGDPEYNARLRVAIERAHTKDMPKENIERAIKRGTGELEGVNYEEYTYEGYGPGGVAVFVEAMSDNKNRTVAELRHLFESHDGDIGEDGCVAWQFERKGLIQVDADAVDDIDSFMLEVIEMGGEELEETTYTNDDGEDQEALAVYTDFTSLHDVDQALRDADYEIFDSSPVRIPQSKKSLDRDEAEDFMEFYDEIDDHDDVQKVFTNADIDDDLMAELSSEE